MTAAVKFCDFCKKNHELVDKFWYKAKTGVISCKEKRRAYNANYVKKNKEKLSAQWKEYRESHKEESKKWKTNNKTHIREYERKYRKKRRSFDLDFRIRTSLRARLYQAIRKKQKKGSAVHDLGCSIDYLIAYIESKFKEGMSWENWGRCHGKWNIDHIKPLNSFDLSQPEQLKKACHYTNLQPLWFEENRQKSDKVD